MAHVPLGLRVFEVATRVEDELMGINSNLEGPCTRTETWRRLPEFLLNRRVITASTARSLELFRSIVSMSTNWKEWSETKLETTTDEGEALVETLRAIPAPKFIIEDTDITLFQDENCTTPLPQPVGIRVNVIATAPTPCGCIPLVGNFVLGSRWTLGGRRGAHTPASIIAIHRGNRLSPGILPFHLWGS
jgi:hypothetical protein